MKIRHSEIEVMDLRHRIIELEQFIADLRDEILYPLQHEDTDLGLKAHCFGTHIPDLLNESSRSSYTGINKNP